jgi:peptide/nickel transport system substrate-binding protein
VSALFTSLLLPGITGASAGTANGSSGPVRGGNLTAEYPTITWSALYPTDTAGSATADQIFYNLIFGTLFTEGPPNQPLAPGLATAWKVSKNGLVVTMTIRKGVKFQDGTPFNAQAVMWNLQNDLNPAEGCGCLATIDQISSVTAPNATTVVLHLSAPNASLQDAFAEGQAAYILSPSAVQSKGAAGFGASPVGAGPYQVTQNSVDSQMVLTRWPGYWDAKHTYLNTITFLYTASEPSAYDSLLSGQTQLEWGAAPQSIIQGRRDSSFKVQGPPSLEFTYLFLNPETAPFNNPIAREALAYAIDPRPIENAVYEGLGSKVDAMATPAMDYYPGYNPKALNYITYNLSKAQALVKQLGGLNFTFSTIQNGTTVIELATALDKELTAAGMTVTLNTPALAQGVVNEEAGNFQVLLSQTGGDVDPYLYLASKLHSHEQNNPVYVSATMDSLLTKVAAEYSSAQRTPTFKKVFALANKDLAFYPMFTVPQATRVMAKNLQGIPDITDAELSGAYFSK